MTEPIAVDAPAKPAYSRSVPLGVTGLPPAPSPAPTPAPKVDSPKSAANAAVTVAAAAAGVPPRAAPAAGGLLARLTKKQLVIGATAALSLFAGVAAVRAMFPAKDEAPPVAASGEKVVLSTPLAQEKPVLPPKVNETHRETALPAVPPTHPGELPPLPRMPDAPPGGLKLTGHTPVAPAEMRTNTSDPRAAAAPPVVTPDLRTAPPLPVPAPDFAPPLPPPTPSGVVPIGASEPPKVPAAPPTPALPPLPAAGGALPPLPAVPAPSGVLPMPKVEPVAPPSGVAPVIPPPPSGVAPKLPDPGGVVPPPAAPKLPDPAFTPPPAPGGAPKLPDPGSAIPPAAPSVFPVPTDPAPKFDVKPTPAPAFDPPSAGTPTNFVKPVGEADAKPAAPAFAPKTTFDVDVYDPKANDTYETISQEFYNDKRFAAALKAFNQNQTLQGGRYVNVPPIHVLKRQSPNPGGAVPVGATGGPDWGAAPARPVANARNTFVVPQGGMTLQEVARQTMGSQQRWQDIWDLNRQLTDTAAVVPAGTELKLPPDARVP